MWVQIAVTFMAVYYFGWSHIHLRTELHWDNHHNSGHFASFHQGALAHRHAPHAHTSNHGHAGDHLDHHSHTHPSEGHDHGHIPHSGEDHLVKWLPRTESGPPSLPITPVLWSLGHDEPVPVLSRIVARTIVPVPANAPSYGAFQPRAPPSA